MNLQRLLTGAASAVTAGALFLIPAGARAQEAVIGVMLPLSGTHAAIGHLQENSMTMAMEEINARGGVGGRPLVLDVRDTGGRARDARAIVDHFVDDKKYPVAVGGFGSSVALSVAEKCERKRLPLLVVTGSADPVTSSGYRYVFRVAPPRSSYPRAALEFTAAVAGAGVKAAAVSERSGFGSDMRQAVMDFAGKAGWTVAGDWRYEAGTRNLQTMLDQVEEAGPEAVFLTSFPPDASRLVEELRDRLPDALLLNLVPASTTSGAYGECGSSCAGVLNPALWFPPAFDAAARYRERYLDRFQAEPDYHGAQAYAAVLAAAEALRRSGGGQPEAVRDALETVAVNTPYGRTGFGNWGGFTNQNDPVHFLSQWTGRGYEIVWPDRYRTAEVRLPRAWRR